MPRLRRVQKATRFSEPLQPGPPGLRGPLASPLATTLPDGIRAAGEADRRRDRRARARRQFRRARAHRRPGRRAAGGEVRRLRARARAGRPPLRDAGAERFAVATAAEGRDLRPPASRGRSSSSAACIAPTTRPWSRRGSRRWCGTPRPRAALAAAARAAGPRRVAPRQGRHRHEPARRRAGRRARLCWRRSREIDGVTVEGLLTHFCNAESVEGPETARQLALFDELVRALDGAASAAAARARRQQRRDADRARPRTSTWCARASRSTASIPAPALREPRPAAAR